MVAKGGGCSVTVMYCTGCGQYYNALYGICIVLVPVTTLHCTTDMYGSLEVSHTAECELLFRVLLIHCTAESPEAPREALKRHEVRGRLSRGLL